jgi:hypothetical protein
VYDAEGLRVAELELEILKQSSLEEAETTEPEPKLTEGLGLNEACIKVFKSNEQRGARSREKIYV